MSGDDRTRLRMALRPGDVVDLVRGDSVTTFTVVALHPGRRELDYDVDGWPGLVAAGRSAVIDAGGEVVAVQARKVTAAGYARVEFHARRSVRIVRTRARESA